MLQKAIKEILSLTTPASGMKAHAQIGAWHNSLDRMAAVILVSPLLNYFISLEFQKFFLITRSIFLTVGQYNFGNKIPFFFSKKKLDEWNLNCIIAKKTSLEFSHGWARVSKL